jgi:PAS domain S-box-containing protein
MKTGEKTFDEFEELVLELDMARIIFAEEEEEEEEARIVVSIKDLTDRRRAEAELRESEEKFRNLVESISDVIYEIDSQGVIVYVSPIVKDVLGYDPADVIGKNLLEFVYKDDRSRLIERFSELREGIEYPLEYRFISKSGDIRWARTKTRPIMEDGGFSGARGTFIDVTERKWAEEALRDSEALFRSLIDYMHDAMIIINWDGYILFANQAAARIIEFERPEELVGHNIVEYLHPDSFQKAAEDLEAVKADRMGFLSEYQLCSVTGRRLWVESIGGKIIFRHATANLACIRDITDRKRAENDLIETVRQLQDTRDMLVQFEKHAAIGRLAGGVAHEILNPLSIISSRLQFLEAENLAEPARENVKVCREQLKRIVKISRDLHQSAAKQPGMLVGGDLRRVIEAGLQMTERRRKEDHVQVEYDPPLEVIPVKMERDRLVKVMVNLILNACDAMTGNQVKRLIITVQYHVVSPQSISMLLIVADNGHGIPAGDLDKIFEPFFTTKAPGKGTGLGLSVSKGIIQEHGGTIHSENNDMGGASFIVELPLDHT